MCLSCFSSAMIKHKAAYRRKGVRDEEMAQWLRAVTDFPKDFHSPNPPSHQQNVIQIPGDLMPSSGLLGQQTHMCGRVYWGLMAPGGCVNHQESCQGHVAAGNHGSCNSN